MPAQRRRFEQERCSIILPILASGAISGLFVRYVLDDPFIKALKKQIEDLEKKLKEYSDSRAKSVQSIGVGSSSPAVTAGATSPITESDQGSQSGDGGSPTGARLRGGVRQIANARRFASGSTSTSAIPEEIEEEEEGFATPGAGDATPIRYHSDPAHPSSLSPLYPAEDETDVHERSSTEEKQEEKAAAPQKGFLQRNWDWARGAQ